MDIAGLEGAILKKLIDVATDSTGDMHFYLEGHDRVKVLGTFGYQVHILVKRTTISIVAFRKVLLLRYTI